MGAVSVLQGALMESGCAGWIELVVRDYEVLPLYYKGSKLRRGPHPSRSSGPPSPSGKALEVSVNGARYQSCTTLPRAFPGGEGGPGEARVG